MFIGTLACIITRVWVFGEVSAILKQQGMVDSHSVWCIPQLLHGNLWGSVRGVRTFKSILYTVKAEIILGCEPPLKTEAGYFEQLTFLNGEYGNTLRILKYIKRSTDFINITVKVVGDFPEKSSLTKAYVRQGSLETTRRIFNWQ